MPLWEERGALWKAKDPPPKERWDPWQGGATWRGFGLAPRRGGSGGAEGAECPGTPMGERLGWWQHPRAGEQPGEGSGCGAGGFGVGAAAPGQCRVREAAGESWAWAFTCGHLCSCVCARSCPFFGEGRECTWGKDMGCSVGMKPMAGFSCAGLAPSGRAVPVLGAGLASSSSKPPPPRPAPSQSSKAPLRAAPAAVPTPHREGGRVPPSLAISSPFQLIALSFIFGKSSLGPSCAQGKALGGCFEPGKRIPRAFS